LARAEAEAQGLGFIDGIELSCQWGKGGVHIVGLNIDPENPVLLAGIERQTKARQLRGEMIATAR